MASIDVISIGNAILDIVCHCDDEFLRSTGSPKGRMRLVESSAAISSLRKRLPGGMDVAGGSAANTAVGIASLGGKSAFIGKVANDSFGRSFQHDIQGMGVLFESAPTMLPGKETSHSLILVTPDGQRTMNTFLGCSTELDHHVLDPALICAAKFVYLEGYLFDRPTAKTAFYKVARLAVSAARTVVLSLPDPLCVDRHRQEFQKLVRSGIDVLFANQNELLALYQVQSFDHAVRLVGKDVPLAVITRSGDGSVVVNRGNVLVVPAEKVRKVVDATGAGDLYAAGFLYGLARGYDHAVAGQLASFAASEIISQVGPRPKVRLDHLARMRGLLH